MRNRGRGSKDAPKHSAKNPPPQLPPRELSKLPKPIDVNMEMAKRHEAFLARIFRGRRMAGSGNRQSGQMDGRQDSHRQAFAFAWDGKSTMGASIQVSRRMWEKAQEQSHFERPMIALRFYANFRLLDAEALDLVVISANDMVEVFDRLEELEGWYANTLIRNTSSVTTVKRDHAVDATEPPEAGLTQQLPHQ